MKNEDSKIQKSKNPIDDTIIGEILEKISNSIDNYQNCQNKLREKLDFMIVEESSSDENPVGTADKCSCDLEEKLKIINNKLQKENSKMHFLIDSIWC